MESIIEILTSLPAKASKPNSEGRIAEWCAVQGLMTDADGKRSVFTHNVFPPKGEAVKLLPPGKYRPVTAAVVSWDKKELGARIVGFEPLK